MQTSILELIRDKYPYLSQEFGVEKIGVFGSASKGEAKEESDIDIVVRFREPIGFKFIELAEYLENLIHRKVDVLTEAGIDNIRNKEIIEDIKRNIVYAS